MAGGTYDPVAIIPSENLKAVKHELERVPGISLLSISAERPDSIAVKARMRGESPKDMNRSLLSALRKVEKNTVLRAEWTGEGSRERYFDFVLKKKESIRVSHEGRQN